LAATGGFGLIEQFRNGAAQIRDILRQDSYHSQGLWVAFAGQYSSFNLDL
jgi:hypothetical protein